MSLPTEQPRGDEPFADDTDDEATSTPQSEAYPQQHRRPLIKRLLYDYMNLLLLFVPVGLVAGALEWNVRTVFALNFLALVPLSRVLAILLRDVLSAAGFHTSQTLGVMVCNGVEMLVRHRPRDENFI